MARPPVTIRHPHPEDTARPLVAPHPEVMAHPQEDIVALLPAHRLQDMALSLVVFLVR